MKRYAAVLLAFLAVSVLASHTLDRSGLWLLGSVLLLVAAVPLIGFPVLYHWQSKGGWRGSFLGRVLMVYAGVFGMVMCFAVANVVSAGLTTVSTASLLPIWVRPFIWLSVAYAAWLMVWALFKVQRQDRR